MKRYADYRTPLLAYGMVTIFALAKLTGDFLLHQMEFPAIFLGVMLLLGMGWLVILKDKARVGLRLVSDFLRHFATGWTIAVVVGFVLAVVASRDVGRTEAERIDNLMFGNGVSLMVVLIPVALLSQGALRLYHASEHRTPHISGK